MKKLICSILMVAMLSALLTGCGQQGSEDSSAQSTGDEASAHTFVVSLNTPEEMTQSQAVLYAKELIEERTDGKDTLDIHLNATYANYNDSLQAIMQGTLDIAGMESAADWDPATGVLLAPFLFRDYDHWLAFKESDIYDELLQRMGEAVGVHMLYVSCSGFRYVTANKPMTTPEEMAGIKMRLPTVSPYELLPEIFNCSGTPIQADELYMALSTGVVDAEENTYTDIVARKFYEVQDYVIKTGHICTPTGLAMSMNAWNSLTEEEQALYTEIFNEVGDFLDQTTIEKEAEYEEFLKEQGVEILEVDKTPFVERCSIVLEAYPEFAEFYDRIVALQ